MINKQLYDKKLNYVAWENSGKFPTLYSISNKNRINFWKVKVIINNVDLSALLIRTTGIINTKNPNKYIKVIYTHNDIPAYEYAKSRAIIEIKKKIKSGYFLNIKDAKKHLNTIKPMLIYNYEDYKKKIKFPCYVQPKYDGTRVLVEYKNNNIILHKKDMGIITSLPHLSLPLSKLYKNVINTNNFWFDGEIYKHNETLNKITGAINSIKPTNFSKTLKIYIFDCFWDQNTIYIDRLKKLINIFNNYKNTFVYRVFSTKVINETQIFIAFNDYVNNRGYEGLIVRNMHGKYEYKRTFNVLKIKEKKKDVVKIKDIINHSTKTKISVIIIAKFVGKKYPQFKMTANGSENYRINLVNNKNKYINKKIRIIYNGFNINKLPINPRPEKNENDYMWIT